MSPKERLTYFDASALVKLVAEEPESSALLAFFDAHRGRITSALTRVEVVRAIGRSSLGDAGRRRAQNVLERIAFIRLDADILDAAGELPPSNLRTLDAIHLATAVSIGQDLSELVTYDRRLAGAAAAAGLDVATPR